MRGLRGDAFLEGEEGRQWASAWGGARSPSTGATERPLLFRDPSRFAFPWGDKGGGSHSRGPQNSSVLLRPDGPQDEQCRIAFGRV